MFTPPLAAILQYVFGISMFVVSTFLILVVLVQRGRGGGLAGALGGMGGQSAFGTKAGDVFTRVTIVVAAIWFLLGAAAIRLMGPATLGTSRTPQTNSRTQSDADKAGESDDGKSTRSGAKDGDGTTDAAEEGSEVKTPGDTAPGQKTPAEASATDSESEKPAKSEKSEASERSEKTDDGEKTRSDGESDAANEKTDQ